MGTHILWAGLGMLIAATYGGYAFSLGHPPYLAGAAVLVFLAVVSLPFFSEYSALNRGFKFSENDFETDEKKLLQPQNDAEIFSPEERRRGASAWRRHGLSRLAYKLLLIIGVLLLVGDIAQLVLS